MDSASPIDQQRQYFRIVFPVAQRPRLDVDGYRFTILEISEGGASLVGDGTTLPPWNSPRRATITLADGTEIATETIAERHAAPDVLAVRFVELLPLSIITAEQRRLAMLYPRVK